MSRATAPQNLEARVAQLERDLARLAGAGRAGNTTIQGGLFRVRDANGELLVAIGDLDGNGQTNGVAVLNGGVFRQVDADGTTRILIGDIDDTEAIGMRVLEGGIVQVEDESGVIRATLGDLNGDGSVFGVDIMGTGFIRICDNAGVVRALLGDIDETGNLFGLKVLKGGRISCHGQDYVERVAIGDLFGEAGGNIGVIVRDVLGGRRFHVDEQGMHDPWLQLQPFDPADFRSTTSPTFIELWRAQAGLVSHLGVRAYLGWSADPGTTGELRMQIGNVATRTTEVRTLTGASDTFMWAWLHDAPLGTGPVTVSIEARRTAGAGSVNVFVPGEITLSSPIGCTLSGS